jgi:putative nucleotidyltransferase with HDIG domain
MESFISRLREGLSYKGLSILLLILLGMIIYIIIYGNIKPETYDAELFSVSEKTIRSPKTVIDEKMTKEEKQKAADQVEKAYTFQKETANNRIALTTSIFDFVNEVKSESTTVQSDGNVTNDKANKTSINKQLDKLKQVLSENVNEDATNALSDEELINLLEANENDLKSAEDIVVSAINMSLKLEVKDEEVLKEKERISEKIANSSISFQIKQACKSLAKYAIIATETYDDELTKARKQQASDSVEPVKILQGQVIIQEGHLIDRETYRQLELLGLLKTNPSIKPFIGLSLFTLIFITSIFFFFQSWTEDQANKSKALIILCTIILINIVLMKLISYMKALEIYEVGYLFPAALAPMLIRLILNERLALISTILLAACGSLIFQDGISGTIDSRIAFYMLFSGLAGILFLSTQKQRSNILWTGLFITIVNAAVLTFLMFLGNGQESNGNYVYNGLFAVISGVGASVLTIGLLPFFESGFGILSAIKLIELSSPNHPLLKKILTETPGTYHHSVMVANLSEAACEAIGANGLLARVGCYYHDIGKTKRPAFFIENQVNIKNPHDELSPETSRDIIIAHSVDGGKMIRKNNLPKEIADIAEQHHGTTLLKFFYYKAKERDETVTEEEYRYPGPKAQTKEIAVIGVADSVEAAVRSMNHPTTEQIKKLVHSIVQDRLQDGQFNECDITLKELEIVKKTICTTLNGIFHSRIEYPDLNKLKVKEHAIRN